MRKIYFFFKVKSGCALFLSYLQLVVCGLISSGKLWLERKRRRAARGVASRSRRLMEQTGEAIRGAPVAPDSDVPAWQPSSGLTTAGVVCIHHGENDGFARRLTCCVCRRAAGPQCWTPRQTPRQNSRVECTISDFILGLPSSQPAPSTTFP